MVKSLESYADLHTHFNNGKDSRSDVTRADQEPTKAIEILLPIPNANLLPARQDGAII